MNTNEQDAVKILLVDDRPENLSALKAILDTPSYRLYTARSGKEALRMALRESFAVILLDVVMPEMDGFEVAQHLKQLERTRHIPIVFLTAVAADVGQMYRAYDVGAIDYLVKPLDNEVVRKKVAVLVDLVRQREAAERQARLSREADLRELEIRLAELRVASDRRYRKLVEGIDCSIAWTMDHEERLTFVSRQAPRILGYSSQELLEPGFWEKHVAPSDRDAFRDVVQKAFTEEEKDEDLRINHRIVTSDGRALWFHTVMSGERTDGGVEVHGLSVDVSEIKYAEEVQATLAGVSAILSETLDYHSSAPKVAQYLVPSMADWCLIDEIVDGTIRDLAAAHVETLPSPQRRPSDASAASGLARVAATGKAELHAEVSDERWVAEAIGLDPSAPTGLCARSCIFVPVAARGRVLGVMTLVSCDRRYGSVDLALAEEVGRRVALAIDNDLLFEAANRATAAREQLLAVVSHDLRNPLASIVASASMIEKKAGSPSDRERIEKLSQTILRSGLRMEHLIRDLLDFAQLELGRVTIQTQPFAAKGLLDETLETMRPLAAEKGLRFECRPSDGLVVHCDRGRVLQVLSNLVGNAIRFTPPGGSIVVGVERSGDECRFSVSDTGPGIPRDELPKIWQRFWRARKGTDEGVGLGLSIAKRLVEGQDGHIWVESEVGVGTTFYFTLPLAGPNEAEIAPQQH